MTSQERAAVDQELETLVHVLEMLEAGLAVRRAGLIWFLPMCHDSYGAGL